MVGILQVKSALMAAVMEEQHDQEGDVEETDKGDGRIGGLRRDAARARRMIADVARGLGPPFSHLQLPFTSLNQEKSETHFAWDIRNSCELAVAITCSCRHTGASEEECFEANRAVLFQELKRIVIRTSFPERLQHLFDAVVLTRRKKQAGQEQADGAGGGCVYFFARELQVFFSHLLVHPTRSELFPWLPCCMFRLLQTIRRRITPSDFDSPLRQLVALLESAGERFEASEEEVAALSVLDQQLIHQDVRICKIATRDCLSPIPTSSERELAADWPATRQLLLRGWSSCWLRSRLATRFALCRMLDRTRCESVLALLLHDGLASKLQSELHLNFNEHLSQEDFDDVAAIVCVYKESSSFQALEEIACSEEINSLSDCLISLLECDTLIDSASLEECRMSSNLRALSDKFVNKENSGRLLNCIFDLAQKINQSAIQHTGMIASLIAFGAYISLEQSAASERPCSCSFWIIYMTAMKCIGNVVDDSECAGGLEHVDDTLVSTPDKVSYYPYSCRCNLLSDQVLATLILSSLVLLIECLDGDGKSRSTA
eukprot:755246-Hanusia_phi.AAC.4